MSRSVIIVPTFNRPELCYLTLEHIQQAVRPPDTDLWIAPETRQGHVPDPLYSIVTGTFQELWPHLHVSPTHYSPGGSHTILSALKAACEAGYDYIFLIEDDVLVSRDFFAWHLAVLSQAPYFCSIGCVSPRRPAWVSSNPEEFYTAVDYCPYGVCFPRSTIEQYILPHITEEFFSNMEGYIFAHLSDTPLGMRWCEQDGLIHRCVIKSGLQSAFPCVPRSFQAGYYGLHRGTPGPQGTLAERVAFLHQLLAHPEQLAALDAICEVQPCSLEPGTWTVPRLIPCGNGVKL